MSLLIFLIFAPTIVLTLVFTTELFVGNRLIGRPAAASPVMPHAVIVVPAHNEQAVIGKTLSALKEAAGEQVRILVIADNCSDATAATAAAFGIEIVERSDPDRRGKGFALAAAQAKLSRDPPAVVVIMDADCSMDAQSLTELIQTCAATGRACQARYVQLPPVDASPKVQLSTFAFFVRNVVRQRALQRIAGRVHLVGTGMAFPWSVFSGAQLASANIVEDLELGLTLADQDVPPIFVEGAIVASDAATARNTLDQRRRWEGGFLQSAARFGPRQLMKAIRHTNPRELWAALDLFVPPFALLLLIDAGLFVGGLVAASVTRAARLPVAVLGASIALAVIGLLLAWAAGGRRFVSAKGLLLAPAYVLWKVPLYLGFAQHGAPRQWVRTGRE